MTIRLPAEQADQRELVASVENRPVSEVIRTVEVSDPAREFPATDR